MHALSQVLVKRPERLVEEEDGGACDQRARQRDPLLLTTGELVRVTCLEAVEPHDAKHLANPMGALRSGNPVHLEAERHVFPNRHVREQAVVLEHHAKAALIWRQLGHVPVANEHGSGVRQLETRYDAQRRCLAAARGAKKGHKLAGPDIEIERL